MSTMSQMSNEQVYKTSGRRINKELCSVQKCFNRHPDDNYSFEKLSIHPSIKKTSTLVTFTKRMFDELNFEA